MSGDTSRTNTTRYWSAIAACSALVTFTSAGAAHAWSNSTHSAVTFGGTASDGVSDIAVDGGANSYVTGAYSGTMDIDPGPGTTTLTSNGTNDDAYVASFDRHGTLRWAVTFGGTGNEMGRSIAVDADGFVLTSGTFDGTIDLDPGPGVTSATSAGNSDTYVSKFDPAGELVWAVTFESPDDVYGRALTVDPSGTVYIAGNFAGATDFDPDNGTSIVTSNNSSDDVFVVALDPDGALIWARTFGGTSNDEAFSVAVDGNGNVHIVGSFNGTADADPGPSTANIVSAGGADVFIWSLDATGAFLRAGSMGSALWDYATSVTVDSADNVLVAGYFQGAMDLDPGSGTTSVTPVGSSDAFVVSLDQDGDLGWGTTFGGTSFDAARAVAVGPNGDIHVTGFFAGTMTLGSGSSATTLTTAASTETYLATLDPSGTFVRAAAYGASGSSMGIAVESDPTGDVHITGVFNGTADLDPGSGTANLTSNGQEDGYVLRIDPNGSTILVSPDAPSGVIATAGDAQAHLTWTAPIRDGGSPITGYLVESSTDGTTWTTVITDTANAATSASVTGLTNGSAIGFRVAAINALGTGSPSTASASVTPAAPGTTTTSMITTTTTTAPPTSPAEPSTTTSTTASATTTVGDPGLPALPATGRSGTIPSVALVLVAGAAMMTVAVRRR